jgi:polar amino acid transport system substrate-binding protein
MKTYGLLLLPILLLQSLFSTVTYAAEPVRVGIKEIPPFVQKNDSGELSGFTIDLLSALEQSGAIVVTEKKEYENVKDLIAAAEQKEVDLSIGAITINDAREKQVDFSQPMFNSGLTILVRTDGKQTFSIISQFRELFSSSWFIIFVSFACLFTLLLSVFMYFIERRKRDGFLDTRSPLRGIVSAYWWGITALTGQQQRHPGTRIGRIIAIGWMYFGVIFISFFTAQMTSTLTAQKVFGTIDSVDDLVRKKVATIENSTSASFLQSKNISVVPAKDIKEALAILDSGRADAIVYDAPTLQYVVKNNAQYETVGGIFKKEDYGIAFPEGSALQEPINRAILQLKENGEYQKIMDVWFSE